MFNTVPAAETSTPAQRLQALKDARDLMQGTPASGGMVQAFSGTSATTGLGGGEESVSSAIRLAEYIVTGHDYADTHPSGADVDDLIKMRRFENKEQRKDHAAFHEAHSHDVPDIEGILAGAIPVSREFMERMKAGDVSKEEIIHLIRQFHEHPERNDG